MLIITRKLNETVSLKLPNGKEIKIYLVHIKNGQARLGFECEKEIKIERHDYYKKQQQGRT